MIVNEKILNELISSTNNEILSYTVSLCHECYAHVPAVRYEFDNKIYIAKYCRSHGISHHIIESDAKFYHTLTCSYNNPKFNFNGGVLIEGSDRCNLECPHCYHEPDNKIKDPSRDSLINLITELPIGEKDVHRIILSGAESTLRPDFAELVTEINALHSSMDVSVMTNGIMFNNDKFVEKALEAGLASANIGLNHPSYIDHKTVRRKQVTAIENMHRLGAHIGYISYTMNNFNELGDILKEITTERWMPKNFRIRYGSDIGRNPGQQRLWLSDIYKAAEKWCYQNNVVFERIEPADNNIYHVMVNIGGKTVRLIQWCDVTDIDCEELKSGPWCNFVYDGVTNFLHQIIRRDAWKNKKMFLIDSPPDRYKFARTPPTDKLKYEDLISFNSSM